MRHHDGTSLLLRWAGGVRMQRSEVSPHEERAAGGGNKKRIHSAAASGGSRSTALWGRATGRARRMEQTSVAVSYHHNHHNAILMRDEYGDV